MHSKKNQTKNFEKNLLFTIVFISFFTTLLILFVACKKNYEITLENSLDDIKTIKEFAFFLEDDKIRFCEEDNDCTFILTNCVKNDDCDIEPCEPRVTINKNYYEKLSVKRNQLCSDLWALSSSPSRHYECLYSESEFILPCYKLRCINNLCAKIPFNETDKYDRRVEIEKEFQKRYQNLSRQNNQTDE